MRTPPAVGCCTIATVLSAGSISVPLNNDDETADAVSMPPLALVALNSTMPNKPLGRTSRTDALVRILGSALRTIKVNEVVCPSIRTVGVAVFVMLKSACDPILRAAVPALLPLLVAVVPVGGPMVAVFDHNIKSTSNCLQNNRRRAGHKKRCSTIDCGTAGTLARQYGTISPELDSKACVCILAGNMSLGVASRTESGPALKNVRVKVVVCPSVKDDVLATLPADRSAGANDDCCSGHIVSPNAIVCVAGCRH